MDGLRGLAILLVLYWHYVQNQVVFKLLPYESHAIRAGSLAWSGVDLFFVLSGFLLGRVLLDAKGSPNYFKTFYVRRAYRILPLYAVACLLYFAGRGASHLLPGPGRAWLFQPHLPDYAYLTLTQNVAATISHTLGPRWMDVTWSLAVEEQFYLVLPLLVRFTPERALPCVLLLTAALAFALRCLLAENIYATYALMPARADALMLGVLAALSRRRGWRVGPKLLAAGLALSAAGLAYLVRHDLYLHTSQMRTVGFGLVAVCYTCLLLLTADGPLRRVFARGPLAAVGLVAYGLYLFHQPISGLTHAALRGDAPRIASARDALVTGVALVLTFAAAKLAWEFFEQRMIARGHRHRY